MASLSHHPRLTVNHQMHPIPIHKHSQVIFLYRIASYLYNINISYMVPSCQTLLTHTSEDIRDRHELQSLHAPHRSSSP